MKLLPDCCCVWRNVIQTYGIIISPWEMIWGLWEKFVSKRIVRFLRKEAGLTNFRKGLWIVCQLDWLDNISVPHKYRPSLEEIVFLLILIFWWFLLSYKFFKLIMRLIWSRVMKKYQKRAQLDGFFKVCIFSQTCLIELLLFSLLSRTFSKQKAMTCGAFFSTISPVLIMAT